MKKNITSILRTPLKQIRKYLNKTASDKGRDCWLFEPEEKEGKVCLVAHIDTVWDNQFGKTKKHNRNFVKQLIHDKEHGLIWSPDGLGADDRAGVYAALKLFDETPEPYKPYVLLLDYEESGGIGAYEAAELFKDKLSLCTFLIELDRANGKDAVFYNDEPDDFITYITEFGFKKSWGSFSDISIISPEVKRCGVNLSIGYYNQHTDKEYLDTNLMHLTIKKVARCLVSNYKAKKTWELEEVIKDTSITSVLDYYKTGYTSNGIKYHYSEDDDYEECPYCYAEVGPDNLTYRGNDAVTGHCTRCNERFEIW